jgi:hypothetical protein
MTLLWIRDPGIVEESREIPAKEAAMQLTFLGGESGQDGSPRVYATDRGTHVVQGYKVEDAQTLLQLQIPDHETVIEIPAQLLKFFPQD